MKSFQERINGKALVVLPGLNFNNLLGLTGKYEKEPGIPAGLNFNNTLTHIYKAPSLYFPSQ
ncbi:hypothetical protein DXN04_19270 [Chitinophaga silvisoli]|uniref:Uncharacterized protein n=1 Tax=Chitinophaga silvisoli TaxID=2291814 RepID=A0A3E1NZ27_9BACT|nr:hypothetical protein DXN04_19270 [Chitinophaga silvisoli]